MHCIRCGRAHNGVYGQRCEDCWALAQAVTGIVGIPYLSGLGEKRQMKKRTEPAHPDFAALFYRNSIKV